MTARNTRTSYGSVAKFFHWTVSVLVITLLIIGTIMIGLDNSPTKGNMFQIHKLTGILVLSFMVLRTLWTLNNPKPELPPGTKPWEKFAERLVHYSFYFLLIAMPFSGWIMSTAAGYNPHIGSLEFPLIGIPKSKSLAHLAEDIHYWVAWTIAAILIMHVAAALKHHFVDKDNILTRMMPNKK